jgi:hypothetical protein
MQKLPAWWKTRELKSKECSFFFKNRFKRYYNPCVTNYAGFIS